MNCSPSFPTGSLVLLLALPLVASAQEVVAQPPIDPNAVKILHGYISLGIAIAIAIATVISDARSKRSHTGPDEPTWMKTTGSQLAIYFGTGAKCLVASLFVAIGAFGILTLFTDPGASVGLKITGVVFTIGFFLFGVFITSARTLMVLDRFTRNASDTYTIFSIPVYKRKLRGLDRASHVQVKKVGPPRRRNRSPSYPVTIHLHEGEPIALYTSRDRFASRTRAEHVAEFLRLPLHDGSEEFTRVRQADELDTPVAKRPLPAPGASGPVGSATARPAGCRISVATSGSTTRLTLPPMPISQRKFFPESILIPVLAAIAVNNFIGPRHPNLVIAGALVIPVLVHLAAKLYYRWQKKPFEIISVSPEKLQLQVGGLRTTHTHEVLADEIEELIVNTDCVSTNQKKLEDFERAIEDSFARKLLAPLTKEYQVRAANPFLHRAAITARGDHDTQYFGRGLTLEEALYAHAIILDALRGKQQ